MYFLSSGVYQKLSLNMEKQGEHIFSSFKAPVEEGYLKIASPDWLKAGSEKETDEKELNLPGNRNGAVLLSALSI